MQKAIKAMSSFLGVLATLATLIMMIAIVIDVVFRTLYDRSVPGILELSETALVCAVFLGMAYTGATNSHIVVDLLTERLPEAIRRWVIAAAWLLTTIILGWFVYATAMRAIAATEEGELRMGLVNWPLYPARWIIVIGFTAMLIVALVNLYRVVVKGEEVLGVDEQMPDVVEHPYEYVTQDTDEPVAISDKQAASLANQVTKDEVEDEPTEGRHS